MVEGWPEAGAAAVPGGGAVAAPEEAKAAQAPGLSW